MRGHLATLLLLFPMIAGAQDTPSTHVDFLNTGVRAVTTVSVASSSAGVTLCDYIDNECSLQVTDAAAVKVCFAPINLGTTCAAGFTTPGGRCFGAGQGWVYLPREDGWTGQVCGLLESGSTPVDVRVIRR